MKKINFYLIISVVTLLLLCPSISEAQKKKTNAKPKTVAAKSKAKSKTSPTPNQESVSTQNGEPTEAEMKQAVIRTMQKKGANKKDEDTVSIDNALAGSSIKIEEFEKLGCQRANYGAGYFCTYEMMIDFKLYSNEGTSAGNNHAAALNTLMGLLNGGKTSSSEIITSRFIRSKNGWIMSKD